LITQKDVEHVEKLARIAISDEEKEKYQGQLEAILDYVGQLQKINTDHVQPTAHPHEVSNVWREDVARPFQKILGLLKNAPEKEETYFKVKKVIE